MSDTASPIPEDFSDRISPMIVKEVRQGLRSKSFIGSFLLLHGVLVLWAAGYLSEGSGAATGSDGLFWSVLTLGLMVIAMRAQSAVRAERDGRTLELLQLTRISAWSIVAGKWCALMVEAAILVAGVLPYFMLRYYFGTLDVRFDAVVVLVLLVSCGVLAALMTMFSCVPKMVGGLMRVGTYLGAFMSLWIFAALAFNGRSMISAPDTLTVALSLLLTLPYCMIFLGVAAASVASASENIATRQRLWGFALFVPAAIALAAGDRNTAAALLAAAIPGLVIVAFECVLRRSNTSMPLYAEQVARSRWRRPLSAIVAPSHGSGVLCLMVLWLLITGVVALSDFGSASGDRYLLRALVMVSVLNVVLLPAAVGMLIGRVLRAPFAARYWMAFAVLTLPVAMLGTLTMGAFADAARTLIGFFPVGVLTLAGRDDSVVAYLAATAALHLLIVLGVLAPFVVRDWRAVRRMMCGERTEMPVA